MGKRKTAKAKSQPARKTQAADSTRGAAVPETLKPSLLTDPKLKKKKRNKFYEGELRRLHIELVKLQEWIKHEGLADWHLLHQVEWSAWK